MQAVCFSGSDALAMLAMQAFDMVISDLNIPGTSGLKILNKLRQDYRESILALITAHGKDALEEEVNRLGIGYVTKPFGLSLLVQLIPDLIRGAETAKTRDETENAPRILIPDPKKGSAGMP